MVTSLSRLTHIDVRIMPPPLYLALFDEKGRTTRDSEVYTLIAKHNWGFDCAAVKYYYSHERDTGCKGNYTAIYAWR